MKGLGHAWAHAHAPNVAGLAPSPAVDEELLWFFTVEDGDTFSSSNFGRMLSSVTEDGAWRTPEDTHALHSGTGSSGPA